MMHGTTSLKKRRKKKKQTNAPSGMGLIRRCQNIGYYFYCSLYARKALFIPENTPRCLRNLTYVMFVESENQVFWDDSVSIQSL